MGWFSFGSSGPKSTTASDGGRIAPDRSSREQCYQARDLFFTCLDKNDILDAIKSNEDVRHNCTKELAAFETTCSKTWVCNSVMPTLVTRTHILTPSFLNIGEILQRKTSYGVQSRQNH
jgi:hypothetical protein